MYGAEYRIHFLDTDLWSPAAKGAGRGLECFRIKEPYEVFVAMVAQTALQKDGSRRMIQHGLKG